MLCERRIVLAIFNAREPGGVDDHLRRDALELARERIRIVECQRRGRRACKGHASRVRREHYVVLAADSARPVQREQAAASG